MTGEGVHSVHLKNGGPVARPNFSYQKRQKELARKKKKEEKRLRKLAKKAGTTTEGSDTADDAEGTTSPIE